MIEVGAGPGKFERRILFAQQIAADLSGMKQLASSALPTASFLRQASSSRLIEQRSAGRRQRADKGSGLDAASLENPNALCLSRGDCAPPPRHDVSRLTASTGAAVSSVKNGEAVNSQLSRTDRSEVAPRRSARSWHDHSLFLPTHWPAIFKDICLQRR